MEQKPTEQRTVQQKEKGTQSLDPTGFPTANQPLNQQNSPAVSKAEGQLFSQPSSQPSKQQRPTANRLEKRNPPQSALVDIAEIVERYLPMSKRKARKFVSCYLEPKRIGNRIFVEREKLEALLSDPDRANFPLDF